MTRILFIFLDGVGIGEASGENPFYAAGADFLPFYSGGHTLPDGTPVKAIDAVLGIDGLPQSASGQTTLYTGENIPAMLKEHKGSYPNKLMRQIIKEKNVISRLRSKGLNAGFINVYPFYSELFTDEHVNILEDGSFHFSKQFPHLFKRRISTTTCMMIANGLTPFSETDIIQENAIYQEYSNGSLVRQIEKAKKMKALGALEKVVDKVTLPHFSPEKAAEILCKAFQHYDFLLYEYFQTDIYGHRHSFEDNVELIRKLNRLTGRLISLLDKKNDTLLITSDHGNLEDGGTRAHTRNPVPLVVWGHRAEELRGQIDSLVDVTPAIEKFYGEN
jgi:hypothetical protein